MFLALSKSPNAHFVPQLTMWTVYSNDMKQAFDRVWAGTADAPSALNEVQVHSQAAFVKSQERWDRLSTRLTTQWAKEP